MPSNSGVIALAVCNVPVMTPLQREALGRLAKERAQAIQSAELVTNELRVMIQDGIREGWLSELGASKATGVGRTTIRTWVGKK